MAEVKIPIIREPVECGATCPVGLAQISLVHSGAIPDSICPRLARNHVEHASRHYLAESLGFSSFSVVKSLIDAQVNLGLTREQVALVERFRSLSMDMGLQMFSCPALEGETSDVLSVTFAGLELKIEDIVTQYRKECGYI